MKVWMIVILFVVVVGAFAQDAENDVDIVMEAYIVTMQENEDGDMVEVFEAANEAQPGDLVEYRILLANDSDDVLEDVGALGPVPANTMFVADSETQAAAYQTEFSIDGGASYSPAPTLTVTNDAGEEEEVMAEPEEFNSVRWTLLEPLDPQDSHSFSYRVTVR